MKTSTLVWIILILAIVALWGYWYSVQNAQSVTGPSSAMGLNGSPDQGNLGQPGNGQVQQPGADGQEDLVIGDNLALGIDSTTTLGSYLIGYNGMTLYTFTKDAVGSSTCYGACATKWPPYIVTAGDHIANLQAGVNGAVGTIARADGQLQLTYKGLPLYFYEGDTTGSDTKGQGLGGVWFVVKP